MNMQFQVNTSELNTYIERLKKDFRVYYPIKANSNKRVVAFLSEIVDGYEADSLYHIAMLIKNYAVMPDNILYSYPLKSKKDIATALQLGIRNFVVDDIRECEYIIELAPFSVNFILRIDVSAIIDVGSVFVKWGANLQEITGMQELIKKTIHKVKGFSFYLPQEISSRNNFIEIFNKMFIELNATDYEMLDIGGGISDEILPEIIDAINSFTLPTGFQIIIEQGKHLLNRAIDLIVEVLDIRYKNGKKLVFIDSGIYHGLLDVVLKNVRYEIIANEDTAWEKVIVCGDSSDVSDIIGEYELPTNLKSGDTLIIKGCGAYCEELITPFSKKKKPTLRLT